MPETIHVCPMVRAREATGLTLEQAANLANIPVLRLHHYERTGGKPPLRLAKVLAQHYRCNHHFITPPKVDVRTLRETRYLYVLKSGSYYKIGQAVSVDSRIAMMQTGNPLLITKVYSFPYLTTRALTIAEHRWHRRFAEKCVRGEWFRLSKEELKEIADVEKARNKGRSENE